MSIRLKLLTTFLAIAIIPVIIVSALSLYNAENSLEKAALSGLSLSAEAKKAQLLEYLSGKKGRTIDFASDGFIRDQVELISQSPDIKQRIASSKILNSHLKLNKKTLDEEIVEIRLLDVEGKIIAATEGEFLLGLDTGKNQPYFLKGLEKTYVQDAGIFMHYGAEKEVLAIGAPLKGRAGAKTIGILVNFYSLDNIKDVLLGVKGHQWGKQEKTQPKNFSWDIFLANQHGLLITPSKKISDYQPLKIKINTEPVLKGIGSSLNINQAWLDIKGNQVFGASAIVQIEKDWKWILAAEQDKKDVLEPVYALRRLSILTGLITLLLTALIAFLIAKTISRPIREITLVSERISKGQSNARIDIRARNELGKLAEAFNRMLENRLQAEEMLQSANAKIGEEKTKYELLLSSIGDALIAVNQEGRIMMINHAAEKMFGFNPDEIIGRSLFEVAPSEDEKGSPIPFDQRTMSLSISQKTTMHRTAYYFRGDNTKFTAAVTASPIIVEGKTIGAIEILRDITKEKEVDRMKTDFISTVSHEIRTPLTTIREGVSQVLDGILGETTQKQKEVFSIVLEDADRLKRIIDNLLDISKIEAGMVDLKREFVDIAGLIQGTTASFSLRAKEKGLRINLQLPQKKIKAFIDKDRIIQAFTNLIGNALKFTQAGEITLLLKDKDKEKEIECSVSDTGKGIAKEDLPRVFSKFQQFGRTYGPGEKGTGLGLSITKGIIELHKGKIWVTSELDQGTKFTLTLPKYTTPELLKECLGAGLKRLTREDNTLSLFVFKLKNFSLIPRKTGPEEAGRVLEELEMLVKSKTRRETDIVLENDHTILMLLSGMKKAAAEIILERIKESFENYFSKKEWGKEVVISYETVSFPEDGKTADELIAKVAV